MGEIVIETVVLMDYRLTNGKIKPGDNPEMI